MGYTPAARQLILPTSGVAQLNYQQISLCYTSTIHVDKTEVFYGDLRKYIQKHANVRPDDYTENVVYLLSRNYHHNPNWYYAYIMQIIGENNLKEVNQQRNRGKYKYATTKKFKVF